jgi:hypothetical protein
MPAIAGRCEWDTHHQEISQNGRKAQQKGPVAHLTERQKHKTRPISSHRTIRRKAHRLLGQKIDLRYPRAYKTGYYYRTGMSAWTPMTLTSTKQLVSNAWYPKTATVNLSLNSTQQAQDTYTLGYICSSMGGTWKCGCRDAACTQSYWQTQMFRR